MASLQDSKQAIEALVARIDTATDSLLRAHGDACEARQALEAELKALKAQCATLEAERDAARRGEAEARALLANASATLAKSIDRLGNVLEG